MTASSMAPPSFSSASAFSFCKTMAEISSGRYHCSAILTSTPPWLSARISKGSHSRSRFTSESVNFRPMRRLMEKSVCVGLVTAWRLAMRPVSRSPDFEIATIEGVVRLPSLLSSTFGSPPSMTAMAEFVVPKSIPSILGIPLMIIRFSYFSFLISFSKF